MEEMNVWFEVVRAILPQRYSVRLAWQNAGLIVATPGDERVAWIDRFELAHMSPTSAIELIQARLSGPESRLARLFDQPLAV